MQADLPFYETAEDALKAAVQALGGTKKVGSLFWGDLQVDRAGTKLSDCLNTGRPEKLDLSQVMTIFSLAKTAGCHAPFAWWADQIGYDIKPIAAAEEVDRLTSVVETSTRTLATALATLERLQRGATMRAVA